MKLKILSILLVGIGLLQALGHITGNKTIKNLGLITVASPLPIVFTQQKGFLETFGPTLFVLPNLKIRKSLK